MRCVITTRPLMPLLAALVIFAGLAAPVVGEEHSGWISTETWTLVNSPHVITGDVSLNDNDTLGIEAGCEVRFNTNCALNVYGTIIADGTASNHIVFTSHQTSPSPGDWKYLYFWYPEPGCLLDYCDILYGGSVTGMVYMGNAGTSVTMSNCSVQYSGTDGIELSGSSSPSISGCTIAHNAEDGLFVANAGSDPLVSDCTFNDNGGYAASVYGASAAGFTGTITITGNTNNAIRLFNDSGVQGTWYDHGVPYVVAGNLQTTDGQTLTLSPGVELRFAGNYHLQILGTLVADGEPANHIVFTSSQSAPAQGDWDNLYFWYPDAGCLFDYCDFRYGGSGTGMLWMGYAYSNITMTNCVVDSSGTAGITLATDCDPTISGCSFGGNLGDGLYTEQPSSDPLVSGCTFHDNGGYAATVCGASVAGFTGTITITGNANNAIRLLNDSGLQGTWYDHGVPYVVAGNLQTTDFQTLTLSPGVELRFAGNYHLQILGTLVADGEPANHIVFTSSQSAPAQGDWDNLYFWYPDAGCLFDYCDFRYGGSGTAMVYMGYALSNITMSNCVLDSSDSAGILLGSDSDPVISGCSFGGNAGDGLYADQPSSDPLVSDCTFHDNGGYAASVCGGSVSGFTGTMSITGNANNAIRVFNDGDVRGTWHDHGVPYVVAGNLQTMDAQTLTLSPGVELRFAGDYFYQTQGTLVADGEPANRIVFTSNQDTPAPGDWKYVQFWYPDPNTVLDYCDFRYGGSSTPMVDIQHTGANMTLTNCTFEHSAMAGVQVASGSAPSFSTCLFSQNQGAGVLSAVSPTFQHCQMTQNLYGFQGTGGAPVFAVGNEIINNTSYGFYLTGACAPVFGDTLTEWNDIHGNGTYDFYNGNSDVYAYYVYWGTTDPSVIASHIWDDVDSSPLGVVYFTHWLDETHENEQTLVAPVVTGITAASDTVHIVWNPVPGALSYRVNSSVKPWASYAIDGTGIFADTTWAAPLNGDMRFYRVNAVAGSEVSAPSSIVGYEQYPADIP